MQEIEKYESMVKIRLTGPEREWVLRCADEWAKSFDGLSAVDTGVAEPLVTVLDIKNTLREDITEKNIPKEILLANAPEQNDGYFQVPKTVEG